MGQFGYSQLGPRAVTHFINEAGLLSAAQPPEVFYSVDYKFNTTLCLTQFAFDAVDYAGLQAGCQAALETSL